MTDKERQKRIANLATAQLFLNVTSIAHIRDSIKKFDIPDSLFDLIEHLIEENRDCFKVINKLDVD